MVHGQPSPPNIFNLVIEVNVEISDHGGHDTWCMVRGHHFMTPQGIYSIKIFVSLGHVLSRNSGEFELDFESISVKNRSIYSQFDMNFIENLVKNS